MDSCGTHESVAHLEVSATCAEDSRDSSDANGGMRYTRLMRFLALCFTFLMGCSVRQEPQSALNAAVNEQAALTEEAEERNTKVPTEETTSSPPKLLTLDKLFASGKVVIGQRGECETWSVTTAPKEPANPALEHPWSLKNEEDGLDCTGFKLLRLTLGDETALIHSPTEHSISCKGPSTVFPSVMACAGPYTWHVHKRSADSIKLVLPWKGDPAHKAKHRRYQTWYLSEAACKAEQHIVLQGGCN